MQRALAGFDAEAPAPLADALNRTAFEVLDAEEAAVRASFTFASESTARFLGRGFYFDKATPANLVATVKAKPKANALLIGHVRGDTIRAGADRLTFRGKLAVPNPANLRRSARGKVSKSLLPSALVAPGGRGFVSPSGDAILRRSGKRRLPVRVLYALVDRATLRERFDHIRTARETAARVFPAKAARAIAKAAARVRGGA